MSTPRLFCPQFEPGEVTLSLEESHHAGHVLRLKGDDCVTLFDGRGSEAQGRLIRQNRGKTIVEVGPIRQRAFELQHRITLAVAMGRQHRQGYLVEKCTELGVAAIQPIITGRSVTKPGDHAVEKWSRRAIEAAKQSGRAWIPLIHSPTTLSDMVDRASSFSAAFIADIGDEAEGRGERGGAAMAWSSVLARQPEGAELLVLVGPEGGWTDEERASAARADIVAVALSPTILRTETAAVAVCAAAASVSIK